MSYFSDEDISREARKHVGGGKYAGPVDTNGFAGVQLSVTGQESIDRAQRLLAGVEGGMEKALRRAVKKAAERLRKSNVTAVRKRYAIPAKNIRDEENVHVSYSYSDGVQATVTFAGQRIPLFRFDGASPTQPTPDTSRRVPVKIGDGGKPWHLMYPGVAAYGHVLKSTSPKYLAVDGKTAFVAIVKAGKGARHTGIYVRTGGLTSHDKDEIEELFGPSVPQMLGNEDVEKVLAEEAMQSFDKDMDSAIMAILSGYMR